jgi:hypothetical protein
MAAMSMIDSSLATPVRSKTRARTPARKRTKLPLVSPVVSCMFCAEPVVTTLFAQEPAGSSLMSASCPNCGLTLTVTPARLTAWTQPTASTGTTTPADALRARRVALATRAIQDSIRRAGDWPEACS